MYRVSMQLVERARVAVALAIGTIVSVVVVPPAPIAASPARDVFPRSAVGTPSRRHQRVPGVDSLSTQLLAQGRSQSWASMTLLPNWLISQGSVLELARPLSHWISSLNPLSKAIAAPTLPNQSLFKLPRTFTCLEPSTASAKSFASRRFSDWLNHCLLGNLDSPKLRKVLAKEIETAFREADLSHSLPTPVLAGNLPAAQLGDRLLFTITPEMAESAGENGEVLATRWVNQLRLLLGAEPLTLLQSQILMHDLKPTGKYLEGPASWYGPYFHGRLTATGEIYDQDLFTAAHQDLPFDTYLKITNLDSGEQLIVRVNDRGPYVGDRVLDLSNGAATYLGTKKQGVVQVRAEILEPESPLQVELPSYRAVKPQQDPLITMWRP